MSRFNQRSFRQRRSRSMSLMICARNCIINDWNFQMVDLTCCPNFLPHVYNHGKTFRVIFVNRVWGKNLIVSKKRYLTSTVTLLSPMGFLDFIVFGQNFHLELERN